MMSIDTITRDATARLDQLEARLPALPAKWLELNRAAAERAVAQSRRNGELVLHSVRSVAKVADTGWRTVLGTAKWSTGRTASIATTGVRQVTGQAAAQSKRAVDTLETEAAHVVDEAIDRVEAAALDAERRDLRARTKVELYDMAQDLDIDGRATMNKPALVKAILAAR